MSRRPRRARSSFRLLANRNLRRQRRDARRMLFETCEPRLPFASDFGDAPDVYGTLLASNGPHHLITPGVFLGANVDAELDGQPSADATGDNTNGGTTSPPGDEQGVDFDQPLQPGGVTSLEVSANVSGYLSAWIDFNADGDFADAGEKIAGPGALGFPVAVHAIGAGPNRISFFVPPDAVVGNTFARFRFTTDSGDLAPTGVLLGGVEPDGEVEDYQITIEPPVDFGDAPDSYGSKLASDGARHTIVSGLFLGTYVDPEPDAPPRPDLTDPTNTIDEDDEDEEWDQFGTNDDDGVFGVNCTVTAGEVCELAVEASAAGQLDAWFDFNGDGDFTDAGEKIVDNQSLVAGLNPVAFVIPAIANPGISYARFRFSSAGNLGPTGPAADGEVEDYVALISPGVDYGDAPAPYPTARHDIVPGFYLGSRIDAEATSQIVDVNALGDDHLGGPDDEDGIDVPRTLAPSSTQMVDVTASAAGYLNAWIDFNADGDWADAGEQIFTDQVLNPGVNSLSFSVPAVAEAKTFGRFRFSQSTGLDVSTAAATGEVEDYEFAIASTEFQDFGDAPDSYGTLEASHGPAHIGSSPPLPRLGPGIILEDDGQPSSDASADEFDDGLYFDAGVTQPLDNTVPLYVGVNTLYFSSVASAPPIDAVLSGWIDFDHNGRFDPHEQIAVDLPVVGGSIQPLPFMIPSSAVMGDTFARFRISTETGLGPIGLAADGEVEDYFVTLVAQPEDFGDAPNSYDTLLVDDGPRHLIPRQQSVITFNSTNNGGFEDPSLAGWNVNGNAGHVEVLEASNFLPAIAPTEGSRFVLMSTGPDAIDPTTVGDLDGNGDNDFDESTLSTMFTLAAGQVPAVLNFDWNLLTSAVGQNDDFFRVLLDGVPILERSVRDALPNNSTAGDTLATDHLQRVVSSTGPTNGSLFEFGQTGFRLFQHLIATPGSHTLTFQIADQGDGLNDTGLLLDNVHVAAQPVVPVGLRLGPTIDADPNGQPRADSLGDDLDLDGDDEDGVEFIGDIIPGNPFGDVAVEAIIPTGGTAFLDAWVDYNRDGDFDDLGEQVVVSAPLAAGINHPAFDDVPATASIGLTHARFRISSTGGLTPRGPAMDGEVEDYLVLIGDRSELLDFGDAPYDLATATNSDDYETLLAQNGPRHAFDPNNVLFLGAGLDLDHELDGQPNSTATGDDANNVDDENGVAFPLTALVPGEVVELTVIANADGLLDGWIDFDADGDFEPGERITGVAGDPLVPGENTLTITIPGGATVGSTYARFRFSSVGGLAPTGFVDNGEVEDYRVAISDLDFGDAPDNAALASDFATLLASDGARHVMTSGPVLGEEVDAELDGQPNVSATGDDTLDASDDEDGVTFLAPLIPGDTINIEVEVSRAAGLLDAWIDLNGDGDWADFGEKVIAAQAVTVGTNALTFNVPFGAKIGASTMRFRVSTAGTPLSTGLAADGEVEDYRVTIHAADFGDAPDSFETRLPPVGDGARHALVANPTVFLGATVDADIDGQADNFALGDDQDLDGDDEDGVTLPAVLLTGSVATITVDYSHATADAVLNAWIDFDGSGSFDMGEEIAIDEPLVAGTVHTLQVAIPPDAVVGDSFARFRVSTEEGLSAIGPAFDGEVEDYLIPIENGLDFGDAPEPDYSTLLNAVTGGGPRHLITGIYLGSSIDAEADGQPHARALGDDLNSSDDEDGVRFLTPLEPGMMATIEVTATIPAGSPTVYLNGWFDFRADGDWDDPGEHPVALSDATIVNGTQTISFAVPAWVTPGLETFARFRLSTSDFANDFLGPDGILPTLPDPTVPDGEVEDYPIMLGDVLDFGDLPDEAGPLGTPMYPTLLVNNGARHSILSGVFLGQRLDAEADGQPDALATGDDTNGMDDEDGVIFSQMIPGGQATMTVTASADGYVSAWVDFNNDGDLDDANEWIAAAQPVVVGVNTLTFNVPPNAIPATTSDPLTYARVRYELSDDILDPDGAADPGDGGEVEDYAVTIGDLPTLSVNDVSVTELDRGQSSTVTFTVSLAVPYSNTVTVDYSTSDGTARSATADYTPVSGQLTFAPGVTSQTVTVTVPGDISDEADETFFLNLSNAVNASIADAQGTATIVDNDTATVAYTIVLRDPSVAGQPEFPRGTDGLYRLAPGSQFIAEVYADDLRAVGANGGVFQGFADLGYDPDLFDWVAGTLTYGSQFTANQGGSIDEPNQLVDGAGGSIPAFPPPAPVGADPAQLLFRVTGQVHAGATIGDMADLFLAAEDAPGRQTLVFGVNNEVPASYETEAIVIGSVRPWQNPGDPCDVNNDGRIDSLDEIIIINALNNGGSRVLANPPVAPDLPNPTPGIPGTARYLDIDGDGNLTQQDALAIALCPKTPLMLAEPIGAGDGGGDAIEADSLSAIVSTAIEAWEATGIGEAQSAALRSVEFQVTNLEDNLLGLAQGWIILLDQDAAGAGWFVDLTPRENDEFAVNSGGGWEAKENSAAAGRVDLLSVVTHELGHILGYDDLPALDGGDSLDVMIESISRGQRRLPNLAAVDEVFGGDF